MRTFFGFRPVRGSDRLGCVGWVHILSATKCATCVHCFSRSGFGSLSQHESWVRVSYRASVPTTAAAYRILRELITLPTIPAFENVGTLTECAWLAGSQCGDGIRFDGENEDSFVNAVVLGALGNLARRENESTREEDALVSCLRRIGICKIDAQGWCCYDI